MKFEEMFSALLRFIFSKVFNTEYYINVISYYTYLPFWLFNRTDNFPLYFYDVVSFQTIVDDLFIRKLNFFPISEQKAITHEFRNSYACDNIHKLYLTKKFEDCVFIHLVYHRIKTTHHVSWHKMDESPYSTLYILRTSIFDAIITKHKNRFKSFKGWFKFMAENNDARRNLQEEFIALREKSPQSLNNFPEEALVVDRFNKTNIVNVFDCTDIQSIY